LSKCWGHQNLQLLSSFTITIAHVDTIERLFQMQIADYHCDMYKPVTICWLFKYLFHSNIRNVCCYLYVRYVSWDSSWGCLGLAQPRRPTNTTPSRRLVAVGLPARLPGAAQTRPHRGLALLGRPTKHAQVARFHLAWAGHGLGAGPGSPAPTIQRRP
jgi:hypothetical protein